MLKIRKTLVMNAQYTAKSSTAFAAELAYLVPPGEDTVETYYVNKHYYHA